MEKVIKYNDLDKDSIADSLAAASKYILESTVEGHSDLDGYISEAMSKWHSKSKNIKAIRAAQSDTELARILVDAKVKRIFADFQNMLIFRAKTDSSGKGLKVYQDLERWKCLNVPTTRNMTPIRYEIGSWFAKRTEQERALARNTELPKMEYGRKTYGVVFFDKSGGRQPQDTTWRDEALKFMRGMEGVVRKYKARGEYSGTRTGVIDKKRCYLGVMFETSTDFLEDLLKQFPNAKIVDRNGKTYIPQAEILRQKLDKANADLAEKLKDVKGTAPEIHRRHPRPPKI